MRPQEDRRGLSHGPSEPFILGEAAFHTQVAVEIVFPLIPTVFWTAFGGKVPWSSDGGGRPMWLPHL